MFNCKRPTPHSIVRWRLVQFLGWFSVLGTISLHVCSSGDLLWSVLVCSLVILPWVTLVCSSGDSSLDYSRAFSGDVCEVLDLVWCLSQTLFMIGSSQPWLCMVKIGGAVIEHYVQLLFHCWWWFQELTFTLAHWWWIFWFLIVFLIR